MKKMIVTAMMAVVFLLGLHATHLELRFGGTTQVSASYNLCSVHEASGQLRFY